MRDEDKTTKNEVVDSAAESFYLALDHVIPDELRALSSNHITVQHNDEGDFIISFFDVVQPIILGDRKDVAEQLKKHESVKAHCIARIVISAGRMPKLIGALANTYERFLTTQKNPESTKEDKKHAV